MFPAFAMFKMHECIWNLYPRKVLEFSFMDKETVIEKLKEMTHPKPQN